MFLPWQRIGGLCATARDSKQILLYKGPWMDYGRFNEDDRSASRKPRLLRRAQGKLSKIDIFLAGKPRSSERGASLLSEYLTNEVKTVYGK